MVIPHYNVDDKITNIGERCLLIIYLMVVLFSSLIGDTIILIASVRYNAIKLNKFIVAVMQHIAVWDLLQSISFILPTITSLLVDEWVFGDLFGQKVISVAC